LFVSCATFGSNPISPVHLTDNAKFELLPPSAIETPFDGPQQISGEYGGNEYLMDAWTIADETKIDIVVYTSMAVQVATLSYDGTSASLKSSLFPKSLKPEYIIADFQLVYYKSQALAPALAAAGLTFREEGNVRTVSGPDGAEIIKITKTGGTVVYQNKLRKYSYTLRSY
jgi:hypothetical protein